MKYSQAKQGRIFVIRLENGEVLHEEIEKFALAESVKAATVIVVGGAAEGSRLVVGPQNETDRPIKPLEHLLADVHEIAGAGTLFPDEEGRPVLHLHAACGRQDRSITGCTRTGVVVWQIMEVVVFELLDVAGIRVSDPELGFKLLDF